MAVCSRIYVNLLGDLFNLFYSKLAVVAFTFRKPTGGFVRFVLLFYSKLAVVVFTFRLAGRSYF